MADMRLIYTTWPNPETAAEAARELVEQRFAACANVVPGALSFFWHEDEVQGETEVIVIFKTAKGRANALLERLKERHPYDLPAFVSLDTDNATSSKPYLDWVEKESSVRGRAPKRW